MYRQKIFRIVGFLVLIFVSIACNDFLTRKPLDELSSGSFWKSKKDVQLALAGCYDWLSPQDGAEGFGAYSMSWATLSDNAYPRGTNFSNIAKGEIQPTSGGIVSDAYNNYYSALSTINNFIYNAQNTEIEGIDDSTLTRYIAEVRFLRAYYYFRLSNLYGGVPLILKPIEFRELDEGNIVRSTKEEVLQAILDDLDFAISNLPAKSYTGHAVKGSALGLKTRVLLYNSRFEEAATTAKTIMENNNFSLAKSYSGLFLSPGQQNNPEIMFSARYQLPNKYSSMDYHYAWIEWILVQPLKSLEEAYECVDGQSIERSPLYNPNKPYEKRDPRLRMTLYVTGDSWVYGDDGTFDADDAGAVLTEHLPKKYIDTSRAPYSYSTRSDQDWVILRYADILLMYAEAQNEIAGPDQSVYDAVNKVRARPGVNMPSLPAGLTKEEMRQHIRRERRVELALEGQRYFDLKRWRIADKIIPQLDVPGSPRKFESKHYLWPIPQSEIDKTGLEQTPGY